MASILPSPAADHLTAIHRDQATLSARRLARVAIEQRRARISGADYPAALPSAPTSIYTGETATWRRLDDGSAEIAFPETERAWEAIDESTPPRTAPAAGADEPKRARTSAPNLVWRLAA